MVYGRGCFDQLDEIIAPSRKNDAPVVFILDHFFKNNDKLKARIPLREKDMLIDADVTHEPKTSYIDELTEQIKDKHGNGVAPKLQICVNFQ